MEMEIMQPYLDSVVAVLAQMSDIALTQEPDGADEPEGFSSLGVSSVITFTGKKKGRLIIDLCPELAMEVTRRVLGEPCDSVQDRMLAAVISELNNTIAGNANTELNNRFGYGLRLAPPIVATGTNMTVSSIRMEARTFFYQSDFGRLKVNIGFQGGND